MGAFSAVCDCLHTVYKLSSDLEPVKVSNHRNSLSKSKSEVIATNRLGKYT